MKLSDNFIKQLQEDLSKVKTYPDLMGKDGAIKKLIKKVMEEMLESELTEDLGYEKNSPLGNNSGNSRNGHSGKTIRTDQGEIDLKIPRDRNGEFDPVIIKKYEKTLGPIEDKIISMYAKGMTTRDIKTHIEEIYGIDISATMVSNITDRIVDKAKQWQNRPLNDIYAIVYFDAIHFKVREDSQVRSRAAYTCLSIDLNGHKDLLGLWVSEAEGANFWLSVLTDLRNRGIKDILIASVDGLKGFPEAIESTFPECEVQQCIIHQIRNSLKYVATKNRKEFAKDLKTIYTAPTKDAALTELNNLEDKWGKKYPLPINSWKNNWDNLSTFFSYPEEIRRLIYTTNVVENLHRQFRKVTKNRAVFTNDDALIKMLYLAYRDISKKWTQPIRNWAFIISQLSIRFNKRLEKYL